jgi:hypothetical protein
MKKEIFWKCQNLTKICKKNVIFTQFIKKPPKSEKKGPKNAFLAPKTTNLGAHHIAHLGNLQKFTKKYHFI